MNTQTECNARPDTQPELPLVVLTDLDGTLLDHHSYSAAAAQPALQRLKQWRIPVIFNTSKTRDEVIALRQQLDNHDPFVCENGSAVFLPRADHSGYNPEILGASYADILKVLHQLRTDGFRFRGFNDMPASEVAALTGLTSEQAHLAKQRHGSEPLIWNDTDDALERFVTALSVSNLHAVRGGRFLHVMGNTDKTSGVEFFRHYYAHCWQCEVRIIALGDGDNDRGMLENADHPIVIPGASQTLTLEHPNTITAPSAGPEGWNTSINALLEYLQKEFHRG